MQKTYTIVLLFLFLLSILPTIPTSASNSQTITYKAVNITIPSSIVYLFHYVYSFSPNSTNLYILNGPNIIKILPIGKPYHFSTTCNSYIYIGSNTSNVVYVIHNLNEYNYSLPFIPNSFLVNSNDSLVYAVNNQGYVAIFKGQDLVHVYHFTTRVNFYRFNSTWLVIVGNNESILINATKWMYSTLLKFNVTKLLFQGPYVIWLGIHSISLFNVNNILKGILYTDYVNIGTPPITSFVITNNSYLYVMSNVCSYLFVQQINIVGKTFRIPQYNYTTCGNYIYFFAGNGSVVIFYGFSHAVYNVYHIKYTAQMNGFVYVYNGSDVFVFHNMNLTNVIPTVYNVTTICETSNYLYFISNGSLTVIYLNEGKNITLPSPYIYFIFDQNNSYLYFIGNKSISIVNGFKVENYKLISYPVQKPICSHHGGAVYVIENGSIQSFEGFNLVSNVSLPKFFRFSYFVFSMTDYANPYYYYVTVNIYYFFNNTSIYYILIYHDGKLLSKIRTPVNETPSCFFVSNTTTVITYFNTTYISFIVNATLVKTVKLNVTKRIPMQIPSLCVGWFGNIIYVWDPENFTMYFFNGTNLFKTIDLGNVTLYFPFYLNATPYSYIIASASNNFSVDETYVIPIQDYKVVNKFLIYYSEYEWGCVNDVLYYFGKSNLTIIYGGNISTFKLKPIIKYGYLNYPTMYVLQSGAFTIINGTKIVANFTIGNNPLPEVCKLDNYYYILYYSGNMITVIYSPSQVTSSTTTTTTTSSITSTTTTSSSTTLTIIPSLTIPSSSKVSSSVPILLLIIVVVIVAGVLGFLFYAKRKYTR